MIMFLSRITMQISSPSVRQGLSNYQDMHRTLMKAFNCSRKEAGLLYRVIKTEKCIYLYAQSVACPHWERIEKNGYHCDKIQDVSELLTRFHNDMVLRFSVLTCPTKKIRGEGKNSKRALLRDESERFNWLNRQGEKNGFRVLEAHEAEKEVSLQVSKVNGDFTLTGILFEGVLQIADLDAFQNAFLYGIGAEKAYGFGMLMIGKA